MKLLATSLFTLMTSGACFAQDFPTNIYKSTALLLVEEFDRPLGIAAANQLRPIPTITLEMVKDFEGWIPSAYNDPAGYCTIGYGHLIALARCELTNLGEFAASLSEERGTELLNLDLALAKQIVSNEEIVQVELTDDQYGALVSFVFNVGSGNFQRSTLLRLLNEQDYEGAAGQFGRWVRAGDRVLPGLVARRACEEAHFRGDIFLTETGDFDRRNCQSLGAAPDAGPLIDVEVGE